MDTIEKSPPRHALYLSHSCHRISVLDRRNSREKAVEMNSTASLIRSVNGTMAMASLDTLERSSQYDFCISKRDNGSTLSAMPSSGIESITLCSDKTDDLLETSPRPVTAPSPQSGLVSRSRVVRVTTPTSPTSKFELEQNAFEQWLVNKLKADQEQRRIEAENDMQKTKEKNEKAEKAKWAHVEWLQQKEARNKEKAEKERKRKEISDKRKSKAEQVELERKQKADEKFQAWLEAKNQRQKAERAKLEKTRLKERHENELKKQVNEAKFKEWIRKNNQSNPDIKPQPKPRGARWTDPTPSVHPETTKTKARPNTAPPKSIKRDFFTVRDSRCFIQWR